MKNNVRENLIKKAVILHIGIPEMAVF